MIMIDVETDMESEFTFHRPYRQGEKEFWETSAYYNIKVFYFTISPHFRILWGLFESKFAWKWNEAS